MLIMHFVVFIGSTILMLIVNGFLEEWLSKK